MKKIVLLILAMVLAVSVSACTSAPTVAPTNAPAQIPDLTGTWKQSNSNSETAYQEATVQDGTIEIYWIDTETDIRALYWAGTYIAPTASGIYSWDSVNDKEKTEMSLMASGDDTKKITYENDELSYEASALGVTQTIRLKKQ